MLGLGGDDAPVVDEPARARGRAAGRRRSSRDLTDPAEIDEHVVRLAAEVTESVVAEGRRVTHVAVKVRTATFFTRTKISKLAGADDRSRRGRGDGARRCSTASSSTGRSACSASGSCSNRQGSERSGHGVPTAVEVQR